MSVILQHPYGSPTLTVTIDNPVLGNTEIQNLNTKFHMAMDGRMKSYIKTPVRKKLLIQIVTLESDDVDDIIEFIQTAGDDDIKLTDWDGDVWQGKILTDPNEFLEHKNFYSLILEFEGIIP